MGALGAVAMGFLAYAAYVAARTTGATNIYLSAVDETTLVWLTAVVLATGIGAFLGYNVWLVRNGPVPTSASLTLTPAFAAVQAMTPIGDRLAWYHDLGARPEA